MLVILLLLYIYTGGLSYTGDLYYCLLQGADSVDVVWARGAWAPLDEPTDALDSSAYGLLMGYS